MGSEKALTKYEYVESHGTFTLLGPRKTRTLKREGRVERPSLLRLHGVRKTTFWDDVGTLNPQMAGLPLPNCAPFKLKFFKNEHGIIRVENQDEILRVKNFTSKDMVWTHDWIEESHVYWDAVNEMFYTPAGQKAVELLKGFLTQARRDEIDKNLEFHLWHAVRVAEGSMMVNWDKPVFDFRISLLPFGVYMDRMWMPRKQAWEATKLSFCWHPEDEVLPAGDLALAYLLKLTAPTGLVDLLKEANW